MANDGRKGILFVAPLEGAVTGQAEISRAAARALAQTDKIFSINTNFESMGAFQKAQAQIEAFARIIKNSGHYDRVYISFKRGWLSVLFDYIFLLVIRTMRPRLVVGHLHGNEMFCDKKQAWFHSIFARNIKMCDEIICLNTHHN